MGWNRYSTTPQGWGVTGNASQLEPSRSTQLVRAEISGPQVWTIRLQSTGPAEFRIVTGNGQASEQTSQVVNGRSWATVVGETVEVNATNLGASAVGVSASVAPGNGQTGAAATASSSSLTLAAGLATSIPASGRQFAIVHNDSGGHIYIQNDGVDVVRISHEDSYRLDYAGAFELWSGSGGVVTVTEFWA